MNRLACKCSNYNIFNVLKKLNYTIYKKGAYNLNIIGVRAKGNSITNKFDDCIIVTYFDEHGKLFIQYYDITTEPGKYYMNHPLSRKGAAILVPGQYRGAFVLGKHKGYKALVQAKPLMVYRDDNKDSAYDYNPDTIEKGMFGINIHRSNPNIISQVIDKWSAGCQVFADPKKYKEFIDLCKKQIEHTGCKTFTYTLINEEDIK